MSKNSDLVIKLNDVLKYLATIEVVCEHIPMGRYDGDWSDEQFENLYDMGIELGRSEVARRIEQILKD